MVEVLLDTPGIEYTVKDDHGDTPLHGAAAVRDGSLFHLKRRRAHPPSSKIFSITLKGL